MGWRPKLSRLDNDSDEAAVLGDEDLGPARDAYSIPLRTHARYRGQRHNRCTSDNAFILSALINNAFSVAFRADFFNHLCAPLVPPARDQPIRLICRHLVPLDRLRDWALLVRSVNNADELGWRAPDVVNGPGVVV